MIQPASLEELASLVEKDGKKVFLFVADWCGDCRYIYPALPEIEETNPEFTFIRVDRDQYMDLAKLWDVYGIPSLVVLRKGNNFTDIFFSSKQHNKTVKPDSQATVWWETIVHGFKKETKLVICFFS